MRGALGSSLLTCAIGMPEGEGIPKFQSPPLSFLPGGDLHINLLILSQPGTFFTEGEGCFGNGPKGEMIFKKVFYLYLVQISGLSFIG